MQEEIEQKLYKAIYNWVKENFGESEADDPSWDIKALAHDLSKTNLDYEIYKIIERQFLREDCKMVAEDMKKSLTDKEVDAVVDEFMDSEAYVDAHAEDWQWFIKQEIARRHE